MDRQPKARTRIKLLRAKLNLTMEKLARRLGVSFVTVARWEKKGGNSPSRLALEKIKQLEAEAGIVYANKTSNHPRPNA